MALTRCPVCLHVQERMNRCEWCLSYLYTAGDEAWLKRLHMSDPEDIEAIRQSEVNRFKPKGEQS